MKVMVKVLCMATYTDVVDVPNEVEDIEEYLNEHLSDLDASNLEFADDIDYTEYLVILRKNNIEFGGTEYFDYEGNLLDKMEVYRKEYHKQIGMSEGQGNQRLMHIYEAKEEPTQY